VDYDPTHSCLVGDDHVVVAIGRDYGDVPPNRGAWRGDAKESIQVGVRVQAVPRLPADWIDADSLPLAITGRDPSGGGGSRRQGRPSVRQFQRMLYRQQQHQQQQVSRDAAQGFGGVAVVNGAVQAVGGVLPPAGPPGFLGGPRSPREPRNLTRKSVSNEGRGQTHRLADSR